jgi:hypothetical protein
MTLYAPTDIDEVRMGGGCGKAHKKAKGAEQLAVKCAKCEPQIMKYHKGWAALPHKVALTHDELEAQDELEAEAKRWAALKARAEAEANKDVWGASAKAIAARRAVAGE